MPGGRWALKPPGPRSSRRSDLSWLPHALLGLFCVLCLGVFACGEGPKASQSPAPEDRTGEGVPLEERSAPVPKVVGEEVEAAQSRIERSGFAVTLNPDPGMASACIVSDQSVTSTAPHGAEVVLSVLCEVPDVTRKRADVAQTGLEDQGFAAVFKPELGAADPSACAVESQELEGEVEPQSEVPLNVQCTVPDVVGQNADEATAVLEDAGFTVTLEPPDPGDPTTCLVQKQRPTDEAEPGAGVRLKVGCPGERFGR
jgi:eukaryotic-like serine/threonine-protein kinase